MYLCIACEAAYILGGTNVFEHVDMGLMTEVEVFLEQLSDFMEQ